MLVTRYQSPAEIKPGSHLEYIGPDYLCPEYSPTGLCLVTDQGRNWYALVTLDAGIVISVE